MAITGNVRKFGILFRLRSVMTAAARKAIKIMSKVAVFIFNFLNKKPPARKARADGHFPQLTEAAAVPVAECLSHW